MHATRCLWAVRQDPSPQPPPRRSDGRLACRSVGATGEPPVATNGEGERSLGFSPSPSPDRKRLAAAANDGAVDLFDLGTGKRLMTLKGREGDVWGVAFSPDGRMLATTGDKLVKLWEVASGKERQTLKGPKWEVAS